MRVISVFSITFLLIAGSVLSGHAQTSPWPMFRRDLHHSGRTPYTGASGPDVHWTFAANDGITSSPSIGHNGTIYVGAGGYYGGYGDSSLYAINPEDGSLKWQYKTEVGSAHNSAGIFSSPAIGDDGTIYVGGLDSYLYVLEDSVTYAKLKWRRKFGNWPVYSSPAIGPNGNVYVGGLDFGIYGWEPNGDTLWRYGTGWCVFSSPVVLSDNTVICGSKDHKLYALTDATPLPNVEWNYAAGSFYDGHLIDCSPVVSDDGQTVYFGTDPRGAAGITPVPADTNLFAVNVDGTLKWAYPVPEGVEGTPALGHDGTIYVGSFDGNLYAFTDMGAHAELQWTFPTGATIDACPTVDGDGTVYIGSRDSTLYAINPDGTEKWRFTTGGGIESSVTIDDNGYMYFGSFDGNLYCLGTGGPDVGTRSSTLSDIVAPGEAVVPGATFVNYRAALADFSAVCAIDSLGVTVYADTISITALGDAGTTAQGFASWTPGAADGLSYTVTIHTVLAGDGNFANDTLTVAVVTGDIGCCTGPSMGNMDGSTDNLVTMGDLTVLIDHLFLTLTPLDCLEEGNMDLSADNLVTMGDLTVLIDHLFISLNPLPPCP